MDPFALRTAPRAGLALGCMNFGRRTPEDEARRIVDRALDAGIPLFDTANAYADGESERVLGRLLAGRRERVLVATKVGWWRKEGLRPERVRESLDESLARLGMDHVDVYYLHAPDHDTPIEATLEGIATVLASGKARSFGVSNFASWQILEILRLCDAGGIARPRVSQQIYNVLVRQLDLEYFRFAAKYALHTTIYNPLAGGLLAGGPPGARFEKNPLYQRRYLSEAFARAVDALRPIAAEAGRNLVELSYAWAAERPGVDSILVGPGSLAHLDAALSALERPLPAEVRAKIDDVHRALVGTDASYAR